MRRLYKIDGTTIGFDWCGKQGKPFTTLHLEATFRYAGCTYDKDEWEVVRELIYSELKTIRPRFKRLIRVVDLPDTKSFWYKPKKTFVRIVLCMSLNEPSRIEDFVWLNNWIIGLRDKVARLMGVEVYRDN